MKQLQLTVMAILGFAFASFAQTKAADKAVIKTPTIQCDMCKSKIEKALFKQYGINSVKVDVKKKTTTVSWITDRTNIENIKTMIANAGYDADDVTADPDAYKKLPPCCKKPSEATPAVLH
ncbi:MAG: copper chaperone [Ferruginibacter sp.]|nr:copper chaperone [Ferruginibacter sp.]